MSCYELTVNDRPYRVVDEGATHLPVILWLHGFTGSETTFERTSSKLQHHRHLRIELAGHGLAAQSACSYAEQVNDLIGIVTVLDIKGFAVVGYSMGGRLALGLACTYPERVTHLVLESSSPGLRTQTEQVARREHDERLAQRLEQEGLEAFITFWEKIPLFASQQQLPTHQRLKLRQQRLHNSVAGLSASLRGMGTGAQPSYWSELSQLTCPILSVVGRLDAKYRQLSSEMQAVQPQLEIATVANAGHIVHFEAPEAFDTLLIKWFKK